MEDLTITEWVADRLYEQNMEPDEAFALAKDIVERVRKTPVPKVQTTVQRFISEGLCPCGCGTPLVEYHCPQCRDQPQGIMGSDNMDMLPVMCMTCGREGDDYYKEESNDG